jgi:hypothetical protein
MDTNQLYQNLPDIQQIPKTIVKLVRKFNKTGNVDDLPRRPKHRAKIQCTSAGLLHANRITFMIETSQHATHW